MFPFQSFTIKALYNYTRYMCIRLYLLYNDV